MIDELVQELRSYPAHYTAAHRAADALEKAEKNNSHMRYYACRLEDEMVNAQQEIEGLREHIAQQQIDIVTLGQEVGRLRDMLSDVIDAWDWWQVDTCDRSQSVPSDAIEIARAALTEEKK